MNKNERKTKNKSIGIIAILIGLASSGTAIYMLNESKHLNTQREEATERAISQCKASAVRKKFTLSETNSKISFSMNDQLPNTYFKNILSMTQVMSDCSVLKLDSACIGNKCNLINEEDLSRNINVSLVFDKEV